MTGNDVLLFPSEWEEPFARTLLEGMAVGIAVIGTTTGGSPEILKNGETGLTYQAGDAVQLSKQMLKLAQDKDFREILARSGKSRVNQDFTLDQMVNKFEDLLESLSK
jgi:glycosyltransferase involved in cell wall biosynthesis